MDPEGNDLNELGDMELERPPPPPSPPPPQVNLNFNHYATKKSAAQSMLDVALLMANSSQLKTVLYVGPHYRFYIPLIVLLSLSITLQVIVGLLFVFIAMYDLNDVRNQKKLIMMNNAATVFVFFTILINIFITALGSRVILFAGTPEMSMQDPNIRLHLPINRNKTGQL